MRNVAFIGLGNMGGPMAANLVKAGYRVLGYDLSAQSREASVARGIEIVPSVRDAVTEADATISMLPAGQHVLAVWKEALEVAGSSTLMVDTSTIDVESAREAHALAQARGVMSLDAPVSGGTEGATAATLTFMVGGEPAAFEAGRPLLSAMGRKVVHCGPAGNGQAAKICNNMLLGISMIATSEAFLLAEKLGLSPQALFDVASTSSGQCYSLTTHCPVPGPVPTSAANRGYKPGFAAALMSKDLQLAQEAARSSGASTPLGAHAAQLYADFVERGGATTDYSGIINFLKAPSE